MGTIARRDFLKAAPAAAAVATYLPTASTPAAAQSKAVPVAISSTAYTPVKDYPIQPKRYSEVQIADSFWKPKIATNAQVTIPFQIQKSDGRGLSGNVLEAAILSLATHPNPDLQRQVDARVQEIAAAGMTGNRGFEAAVTYFQTTGKRDLLEPAIKAAAALYEDFKVNNPPFNGGERDALNCVQLYRATNEKKHLDLAKHYLDIRGLENSVGRSRHNQSYKPVLEQREAVGHAVNCVTLMLSMLDVGILTGLRDYVAAAQRMWADAVERKMYVTGGVGSTGNEGFGEAYDLPNISAYSETCAVLMFMTFNHRLFMATGDGKYMDVLERGMYNNAIAGVSQSGNRFFYVNRLASAGDGRDARWERASLECCPPNLVRFLASMPGYIYAQDQKQAIYVNLYVSSEASFNAGASTIALSVESEMPWGGKTRLTVSGGDNIRCAVKLRIPGWARNQPAPGYLYSYTSPSSTQTTISVNGTAVSAAPDKAGYVTLDRLWKKGDVVAVEFPYEIRRVTADQRVAASRDRVAIERGPMVYCLESPGAEGRILNTRIDDTAALKPAMDANAFGGIPVIDTEARDVRDPRAAAKPVRLIPYYLWANRGATEMTVWFARADYKPGDVGPAGGFIIYDNPNHATDGWRYLEAAPFDQSAGARWGCFRRLIDGARGTAVGTGRQNTLDMLAACTETGSAADLCWNLSINGVRGWFLPSRDELALTYKVSKAAGIGAFGDGSGTDNVTYWASSQTSADMAAHIDFGDLGRLHGDDKDFPRRVRAVRAF